MEFDDLKKIWDAQNNEQLYALNEETLHKRVIQKNIAAKRTAHISEIGLMIIGLVVAVFMIAMGILNKSLVFLPQGLIFLGIVIYIFMDRKKRLKNESISGGSILDDLNQAIRTNDYEIKRQRNMIWWFFVPTVAAMLLNLFKTAGIYSWAVIVIVVVSGALGLIVQRRAIWPLLIKKDDLYSLRKILTRPENQ